MYFTARTVTGAGRGRQLGFPTVNLMPDDVPDNLSEGIYACFVQIGTQRYQGALHYGPRPVFDDQTACEVHLIGASLSVLPSALEVHLVRRLREVQNFSSPEALQKQIEADIALCRRILSGAA